MDILVKQTHECIWHFTHSDENGICFSRFNNSHAQDYEVLLSNGRSDFDVLIDDNNSLHLVCRDNEGSIIYLTYENNAWHKHILLKSKTPSDYDKNFRLVRISGWLNLFYTIEYHGKTMLSHQIIGDSSEPVAIDYVEGDYTACADVENNIWLFYKKDSGAFGCRKYLWSRKKWDIFAPIDSSGAYSNFYPLTDNRLNYACTSGNDIIFNGKVIGKGKRPVLYSENGVYWCLWEDNDRIVAVRSNDRGETWRSSGDIVMGMNVSPIVFRLAYTSYESGLSARDCYGYISDNLIRLYVLNSFMQVQMLPPTRRERIAGSEVEEFARSFPEYAERQNEQMRQSDIGYIKTALKLSELSDRLDTISRRLDRLEKKEPETKTEPSDDGSHKKRLWFF